MDLPGGLHFRDVTRLFDEASENMALDELLMVDGFTLNEAMSAIEIGDPRMDSGAVPPADEQPPAFDPLTPVLPEEVCWILDRTMACEMHWHAGNALAQTVFTCLYMHHLSSINPDLIPPDCVANFLQAGLPIELLTLVIRVGIMGMVKCCDMAYRELVKGNVHDCEDWQGEKSGISLYEGIFPQRIIALLEEVEIWLMSDAVKDLPYREDLLYRIQFRKVLLQLFALELPRKTPFIMPLAAEARHLLDSIRKRTLDTPRVGSLAYAAFDPRITRQLHSIMPMRPLTLPTQEETWDTVAGLLDGWELIYRLSGCENLLAWNAVGILHASNPRYSPSRLPVMRSVAQSVFSNGANIMDRYSVMWLVERFFLEIAHASLGQLLSLFESRPFNSVPQSYMEFCDTLTRFLLQHIWASYHNRPRQRRHFMKTSLDWHAIYESALSMTAKVSPRDTSDSCLLKCIPLAVLHWRASVIRDIILSGFELDLYTPDERPFAYWYLVQVLVTHESILRELLDAVPEGPPAHGYLTSQEQYATLLKEMSLGCFIILCRPPRFDAARRWTNFTVRYKWALRKEYTSIATPDPFLPNYQSFLRQEKATLHEDQSERRKKAMSLFESALLHLVQLGLAAENDFSLQLCRVEFTQHHLASLMVLCESLRDGVSAADGSPLISLRFRRNPSGCAWFPQISPSVEAVPVS